MFYWFLFLTEHSKLSCWKMEAAMTLELCQRYRDRSEELQIKPNISYFSLVQWNTMPKTTNGRNSLFVWMVPEWESIMVGEAPRQMAGAGSWEIISPASDNKQRHHRATNGVSLWTSKLIPSDVLPKGSTTLSKYLDTWAYRRHFSPNSYTCHLR